MLHLYPDIHIASEYVDHIVRYNIIQWQSVMHAEAEDEATQIKEQPRQDRDARYVAWLLFNDLKGIYHLNRRSAFDFREDAFAS